MSVVVAMKHGRRVYMACESRTSSDNGSYFEAATPLKVVERDECLIGCTGSSRINTLVYSAFHPPKRKTSSGDYFYIVNEFVETLRKMLEKRGVSFERHGDDRELDEEFGLLVAYRKSIYVIDDDFSVDVPAEPFFAVGSGADAAFAVLRTKSRTKVDPKTRLERAVKAAIKSDTACGGRIHVKKL